MSNRSQFLRGGRFRNGGENGIDRDLWRMYSHEALDESAGPGRVRARIGERLGYRDRSIIDKYCNGRARNPLEAVRIWVETCRDAGRSEHDATVPLRWLSDVLGYQAPVPKGGVIHPGGVQSAVGRAVSEIADVARVTLDAVEDGEIQPLERRQIGRELDEAVSALNDLKTKLSVGAA